MPQASAGRCCCEVNARLYHLLIAPTSFVRYQYEHVGGRDSISLRSEYLYLVPKIMNIRHALGIPTNQTPVTHDAPTKTPGQKSKPNV